MKNLVKCTICKHWEEFEEGLGHCLNPKVEVDMTDDLAACSLGEVCKKKESLEKLLTPCN